MAELTNNKLQYDGQKGAKLALDLLYDEFKLCMALSG